MFGKFIFYETGMNILPSFRYIMMSQTLRLNFKPSFLNSKTLPSRKLSQDSIEGRFQERAWMAFGGPIVHQNNWGFFYLMYGSKS